jgi:Chaperone of endosialidase
MATIQRPTKEGSVRTYQEKVGLGYVDILASEMDADLDTIYAAWNGGGGVPGGPAGGVLGGTYPNPSFAASNTTYPLVRGGGLTDPGTLVDLQANISGNPGYDSAKSGWLLRLNYAGDLFAVIRQAPAAGTPTAFVQVDAVGTLTLPQATSQYRIGTTTIIGQDINLTDYVHTGDASHGWTKYTQSTGSGSCEHTFWQAGAGATATWNKGMWLDSAATFTIAGATAVKASGTTWANPSDRRLKDDIADYATGLAAITQLQPRTFVYNGKGGSPAGLRGYGFIADEVEPVMPEMVGVRAGLLDPADENETDIQTLDQSNLILALVNAVRELAARLAAVEAPA